MKNIRFLLILKRTIQQTNLNYGTKSSTEKDGSFFKHVTEYNLSTIYTILLYLSYD